NYSLCEKHYNQIVRSSFVKMKSKVDNLSFSDLEEEERKNRKLTDVNDDCGFFNFGVQVSLPDPEYEILFKRIEKLESLNQQLLSEKKTLKRLLNEKLTDKQDHLKLVMEIAKMERHN
ncbi:2908_t:CDS:1, partial [Acaulospora morrowiae]